MKTLKIPHHNPWRCLVSPPSSINSPPPLFRLIRLSSSLTSKASPRSSSSYYGDSESAGSVVYRHKLQFQRPTTIRREYWWKVRNSVRFIGSVVSPVKPMKSSSRFGVRTWLQVEPSRDSKDSFRILLVMWEKMAEISSKYLKEKDFIYVSGYLGSYTKVDECGHLKIFYKVNVDELNYVARNDRSQNNQKSEPKEGAISTSGAPDIEKNREPLYLWQVFFASPHEWWDNRNQKKNPRSPDFKHKDTGECLWLNPENPPWVRRQLQLHDSRMAEGGYRDPEKFRSRVSMWKYDE